MEGEEARTRSGDRRTTPSGLEDALRGVRSLGLEFRYPIQGTSHSDLSYTTLIGRPDSKVKRASFGFTGVGAAALVIIPDSAHCEALYHTT